MSEKRKLNDRLPELARVNEEKGNEETTNSIQTQKTEEERSNDQRFAERKQKAKQIADTVKDPDCRDIFVMRIDLATTEQEFSQVVADMCSCIRSDLLLAEYERVMKRLINEASDPEFRELLAKTIGSSDKWYW